MEYTYYAALPKALLNTSSLPLFLPFQVFLAAFTFAMFLPHGRRRSSSSSLLLLVHTTLALHLLAILAAFCVDAVRGKEKKERRKEGRKEGRKAQYAAMPATLMTPYRRAVGWKQELRRHPIG